MDNDKTLLIMNEAEPPMGLNHKTKHTVAKVRYTTWSDFVLRRGDLVQTKYGPGTLLEISEDEFYVEGVGMISPDDVWLDGADPTNSQSTCITGLSDSGVRDIHDS